MATMTSEVMARATSAPHRPDMSKPILIVVGLPFTVFSFWVAARHGPLGFLSLSWREPWAMQMLLDLCISLTVVGAWIRRDARERGLPSLPYLLALPLGSFATLAYLIHRSLRSTDGGRGSASPDRGPHVGSRQPCLARK